MLQSQPKLASFISDEQKVQIVTDYREKGSDVMKKLVEAGIDTENTTLPSTQPNWEYGGVAISGKYADADIVYIGNGKYRLYYSEEPEAEGFKGRVYSATSIDGINWVVEDGTRKEWATFPSVINLPDGRYRMYFQNQGVIKSAISDDGLSWKDEEGMRVGTENKNGFYLENVAAPTVMRINDRIDKIFHCLEFNRTLWRT